LKADPCEFSPEMVFTSKLKAILVLQLFDVALDKKFGIRPTCSKASTVVVKDMLKKLKTYMVHNNTNLQVILPSHTPRRGGYGTSLTWRGC
jgi:hypothetical protein